MSLDKELVCAALRATLKIPEPVLKILVEKLGPKDPSHLRRKYPAIYIPSPRSMLVSGDNSTNNRIKSFNYELTINRQAVYSLDSYSRVDEVVFLPPVAVSASLDFDAVNFTPEDYKYFISSAEKKNFKVIINDRNSTEEILNLDIPNIQLSSQQLGSSADNKLSITNSYIGYLP